jgi:hypothetical protein
MLEHPSGWMPIELWGSAPLRNGTVRGNSELMNKISFVYGMVVAVAVYCLGGVSAQSQTTYCVRAGANGNGSGSDWNNAYPALPATLQRGATYYVAAGSYSSYTFDDPASGTSVITIKKATAAEHKTDVGWVASYGTEQAIFSASLRFTTDYWVFDGATRNEADWFNSSAYGFVISDNANVQIDERGIGGIDNITVKYTYLKGINSSPGSGGDIGRRHIWIDRQGNPGSYSNWTISRCFFQYGNVGIQVRECANFIVEYNAWADNWSSQPNNHGENVSAYYGGNDGHIYRYNQSRNMIGTAAWAVNQANNWRLYGNVYADCEYGDGFVGFIGGSSTGFQIYNETIIRPVYFTRQISLGGNSVVKNCIFMMGGSTPSFDGCTVSSSSFSAGGTGTGAQTGVPTSIFVNYAGGNYRLAAPTSVGEALAAPFNTDLTGTIRGADGVFDRGAFEFGGVADTTPPVISGTGASAITAVGAVISWTTSEAANGVVEYGTTTSYGSTATSASILTAQVVTLGGLLGDTTYNYRVRSTDLAGNTATSGNFTFRTAVGDNTKPTITLTAPANGGSLSNTVTLAANASDNVGVVGVKFFVSGSEVFDDTATPYSYAWDSRWVNNGVHQVYAQARDAAGNFTWSATNTITVANPPAALPSPVAYWDFNAGGTTATDSLGNNTLTLRNGAIASGAGKFGAGLVLDGVNDRADGPNSASLNLSGSAITVATWVKLESQNDWQQILAKVKETGAFTPPYFAWHMFGGPASATQWTPMFQVMNASEADANAASSVSVNYGEWVHLVGVYDGATVRIYVNGVERGNAAQSGNILSYNQPLYVGAHGLPAEFARGVIDEVRIYSQALSASQVQGLFVHTPTTTTVAPPSGLHVVLQ